MNETYACLKGALYRDALLLQPPRRRGFVAATAS